jgi:hypothetical protein
VRIARDFGTIRELFPPGVTDMRELPHPWFDAIRRALHFLSFEELEPDERPPKSIWLDADRLAEHFQWVEQRRKDKWGGDGTQTIEDPVENPAAKAMVVG